MYQRRGRLKCVKPDVPLEHTYYLKDFIKKLGELEYEATHHNTSGLMHLAPTHCTYIIKTTTPKLGDVTFKMVHFLNNNRVNIFSTSDNLKNCSGYTTSINSDFLIYNMITADGLCNLIGEYLYTFRYRIY